MEGFEKYALDRSALPTYAIPVGEVLDAKKLFPGEVVEELGAQGIDMLAAAEAFTNSGQVVSDGVFATHNGEMPSAHPTVVRAQEALVGAERIAGQVVALLIKTFGLDPDNLPDHNDEPDSSDDNTDLKY